MWYKAVFMRHVVGAHGNPGAIAVTSRSKHEVLWYQRDAISEGGGLLSIFCCDFHQGTCCWCCLFCHFGSEWEICLWFFVVTPAMLATLVNLEGPK